MKQGEDSDYDQSYDCRRSYLESNCQPKDDDGEGNPNLRVGTYLQLAGLGPRFSNTYYATSTVHHFDTEGGYETQFCAECAYLGSGS